MREWLFDRLAALNYHTVTVNVEDADGRSIGAHIVAVRASRYVRRDRVVTLIANYDTAAGSPGAALSAARCVHRLSHLLRCYTGVAENGSGCASLLELAEHMTRQCRDNEATLILVFLDLIAQVPAKLACC